MYVKGKNKPPVLCRWWILRTSPSIEKRSLAGDLEEEFHERRDDRGSFRARLWYTGQFCLYLVSIMRKAAYGSALMFKHYMKTAIRTIRKHKMNTLLNISGLAVALACSMLIIFHVKEELSYEQSIPKSDRIYRITILSQYGDTFRHWAVGPVPMGQALVESIPEIKHAARFQKFGTFIMGTDGTEGEKRMFEERGGFFADPSAVTVFDLSFLSGDPETALDDVFTVVLTASVAKRYFGDEDPVGRTLRIEDENVPLRVTGLIEDPPGNSHLQYDFLVSMETFYRFLRGSQMASGLESRTWKALYTYVLLESGDVRSVVEAKLPGFMEQFQEGIRSRQEELFLQPIREIHLHSKLEQEIGPNGDIAYVTIFSITAVLILTVACVNFINISMAQAFKRLKEVGIRKVAGALKRQLVFQILGESFLTVIVSFALAILLFYLTIPLYSALSGKAFVFGEILRGANVLIALGIVLIVGFTAGFYPALFIARFDPVHTFTGLHDPKSSVTVLRKGLVIFQFVISVFLIFSTITIGRQLRYFREKHLGFEQERLVAISLYGDQRRYAAQNREALKNELLQHAAISNVALSTNLPGQRFSIEHVRPESIPDGVDFPTVRVIRVDEHFLKTMGIPLQSGSNFQRRPVTEESEQQFIFNEAAVRALDLDDPVGKMAASYFGNGEIVGVMDDFNFASLHYRIEPLVLHYHPDWADDYLIIRFQNISIPDLLALLRGTLERIAPDHLFRYRFIDETLQRLYVAEYRVSDLFKGFSALAIFISTLGLFGLSVYSVELRVKEVGIRKALGATSAGIVSLLSRNFLVWVLVANVIAWPLAAFVMNRWLQQFAYQVRINVLTFIVSGLLSVVIALSAVGFQSFKAAVSDPVDALRYE